MAFCGPCGVGLRGVGVSGIHRRAPRRTFRVRVSGPRAAADSSAPRPADSASAEIVGPLKNVASSDSLSPLGSAQGVGVLLLIEWALKLAFKRCGWRFPPALAGMIGIFFGMLLLRRLAPRKADFVMVKFEKTNNFLGKWLAVMFCPILVTVPLSAAPPVADVRKLAIVTVAGLIISLVSTAFFSLLLGKASGQELDEKSISQTKPTPWKPTVRDCLPFAVGWIAFTGLSAVFPQAHAPVVLGSLSATLLGFSAAQRFPKRVKAVAHPLIIAALSAGAAIAMLGTATGRGWKTLLAGYLTRGKAPLPGAGDLLAALLGPAILSFGFQMYNRRALIFAHYVSVLGATFIASVASLFGTAFAVRLLKTSADARLYTIPRMVTAPLAVPIAETLGTDPAMAGSIVTITGVLGANFGLSILDALRIKDPIARGLAVGSSAHGLGTAATVNEPATFPFAAIAMALVGMFSTILVSIPAVRAAIVWTALGASRAIR